MSFRTAAMVLTRRSGEQASSASGAALLGLLGIVLQDTNVLLGVDCSPITVIGVGSGSACSANAVCCENNNVVSMSYCTTVSGLTLSIRTGWSAFNWLRAGRAVRERFVGTQARLSTIILCCFGGRRSDSVEMYLRWCRSSGDSKRY